MPRHVVDLVAEALNERGKALRGARIGVHRRRVQAERPRRPQLAGRRGDQRPRGAWRDRRVPRPARADVPRRRRRDATQASLSTRCSRADAVVVVTAARGDRLRRRLRARGPRRRHGQQLARPPGAAAAGPPPRRRLERRLSTSARGSGSGREQTRRSAATRPSGDPPAGRDARPRLLRRGPARPARGGVARRRGPAGRRLRAATRRRRRRPASSPASTVHRLDVRRHQGAGLPTYLARVPRVPLRAPRGRSRGPTAGAATRSSRSIRRRTSSRSRRCRSGWSASRSCSTSTRRCRSSSDRASRARRTRSPTASSNSTERISIGLAGAAVTVNQAMRDRLVEPRGGAGQGQRGRQQPLARPVRPVRAQPPRLRRGRDGPPRLRRRADAGLRGRRRRRRRRRAARGAAGARGVGSTSTAAATPPERSSSVPDRSASPTRVTFHGRIPIEDVPAAVARADIGIAPTRRDPFTDVSLSTKVFEYAAMGKPVVASRLPMVEQTFPPGTVATYEPGDPADLAAGDPRDRRRPAGARSGRRADRGDRRGARLGARGRALHRARRRLARDTRRMSRATAALVERAVPAGYGTIPRPVRPWSIPPILQDRISP